MRRVRDGEGLDRDLMQHVEVGEGQRGRGGACEMREASEREGLACEETSQINAHGTHEHRAAPAQRLLREGGTHVCADIFTHDYASRANVPTHQSPTG